MRPVLILLVLLLPAALLHAQQRSPAQPAAQPKSSQPVQPQATRTTTQSKPTPSTRLGSPPAEPQELSKEQQTKQDALFKNDPRLKKWAESLEARGASVKSWGNTDEAGMAAVGIKPSGKPATTGGNKNAAAAAYKRKDYQAALQHYKALAADGDTEAAVMLGIMHEKGEGVDKDASAAYAWYGRAANQGDPVARELVRDINDKDQMKAGELDAAAKKYEEIAQELDEPAAAQGAADRFRKIRDETNVDTEIYDR
jgi:TPR repeat protein